jgi:hypothetical protein
MNVKHEPNAVRRYAGISFRPEVLQYLDLIADQVNMDRSWVLNTIVREYAERHQNSGSTSLLSKETVIPSTDDVASWPVGSTQLFLWLRSAH